MAQYHRRLRIGSGRMGPGGSALKWATHFNVRIATRATTKSKDSILIRIVSSLQERFYRSRRGAREFLFQLPSNEATLMDRLSRNLNGTV